MVYDIRQERLLRPMVVNSFSFWTEKILFGWPGVRMKKSQNHGKSSLNGELLHRTLAEVRSTMGAPYKKRKWGKEIRRKCRETQMEKGG